MNRRTPKAGFPGVGAGRSSKGKLQRVTSHCLSPLGEERGRDVTSCRYHRTARHYEVMRRLARTCRDGCLRFGHCQYFWETIPEHLDSGSLGSSWSLPGVLREPFCADSRKRRRWPSLEFLFPDNTHFIFAFLDTKCLPPVCLGIAF